MEHITGKTFAEGYSKVYEYHKDSDLTIELDGDHIMVYHSSVKSYPTQKQWDAWVERTSKVPSITFTGDSFDAMIHRITHA